MVKNLLAMQETSVWALGWEDTLEKGMTTHLSFLPGKFYGQRSLAGYSPWNCKESDMTKRLILTLIELPLWYLYAMAQQKQNDSLGGLSILSINNSEGIFPDFLS